ADQKDSGSSIPGIGGSFDLTDSLILTAPTGYLLFGFLT
ncbi:MAG: phosphatidate cytidylyltransferase, partial [Verrucomicrobia bacterium TMED71]